ncbi:hypothetical protein B0I35DRAFT_255012 [Stachybotrys elegans]|uniref:Uncharacterized protein n=1 Tax=Stachybotrys elegans TaxID=80388 RepID=A0A8K0WPQ9_9HYPO|nr:hypothetical protein B0I35DRAFT_255012 [Stachybotrys elegans]
MAGASSVVREIDFPDDRSARMPAHTVTPYIPRYRLSAAVMPSPPHHRITHLDSCGRQAGDTTSAWPKPFGRSACSRAISASHLVDTMVLYESNKPSGSPGGFGEMIRCHLIKPLPCFLLNQRHMKKQIRSSLDVLEQVLPIIPFILFCTSVRYAKWCIGLLALRSDPHVPRPSSLETATQDWIHLRRPACVELRKSPGGVWFQPCLSTKARLPTHRPRTLADRHV